MSLDAPATLHDAELNAYGVRPEDVDQLVVMNGVDWRTYVALRELTDSPGIRRPI